MDEIISALADLLLLFVCLSMFCFCFYLLRVCAAVGCLDAHLFGCVSRYCVSSNKCDI